MKNTLDRRLETLGKELARWSKSCGPVVAETGEISAAHIAAFLQGFGEKINGCPNASAIVAFLLMRETCAVMKAGLEHQGYKFPERKDDELRALGTRRI